MAGEDSSAGTRLKWFDEETDTPLLDEYVREMENFQAAMEDGIVDESELEAQEAQLVALMKEVEPLLDDELHPRVTQLLLELACYGLMQTIRTIQQVREASGI